jgi:hypothetical protein
MLSNEKGGLWESLYLARKTGLSAGWKKFAEDNELSDGDAVLFELIGHDQFKVRLKLPCPWFLFPPIFHRTLEKNRVLLYYYLFLIFLSRNLANGEIKHSMGFKFEGNIGVKKPVRWKQV